MAQQELILLTQGLLLSQKEYIIFEHKLQWKRTAAYTMTKNPVIKKRFPQFCEFQQVESTLSFFTC